MSEGSQQKHVVVLDDDLQLVSRVRQELEAAGYRVSAALPDEGSIPPAGRDRPDLILLDLLSAGTQEPWRRLQQDPGLQGVPLVLFSGVRKVLDLPLPAGGRALPIRAFVEKPFQPRQLLARVDEILGR